jgi:hypothetical protein
MKLLIDIKNRDIGLSKIEKKWIDGAIINENSILACVAYTFGTISPKKTIAKVTPMVCTKIINIPVAFNPKRFQDTKVVKVTIPILMRLLSINTVLKRVFGDSTSSIALVTRLSDRSSIAAISSELREKKATSDPETSPEDISNRIKMIALIKI